MNNIIEIGILVYLGISAVIPKRTLFTCSESDCKDQYVIKNFCPNYGDSDWKCRAKCKDCSDGKIYHCAKDYKSPEVKDYEEDVIERFTEGCALAKYCSEGKEPALSFVENQKPLKDPLVYCIICKNANRYNPRPEWSSNYSECGYRKQNICSTKNHKIECKSSGSRSERLCRCDARGGYKPVGSVDGKTCSTENWKCMSSDCLEDQFFNYTCAPRCPVGTKRSEDSDECQQVLTRKPNQTTPKPKTTPKQASENITSDPTSPTTRKPVSDITIHKNWTIIVPVVIVVLVVLVVVLVYFSFKHKSREKKNLNRRNDVELNIQNVAQRNPNGKQLNQNNAKLNQNNAQLNQNGAQLNQNDAQLNQNGEHLQCKESLIQLAIPQKEKSQLLKRASQAKSGEIMDKTDNNTPKRDSKAVKYIKNEYHGPVYHIHTESAEINMNKDTRKADETSSEDESYEPFAAANMVKRPLLSDDRPRTQEENTLIEGKNTEESSGENSDTEQDVKRPLLSDDRPRAQEENTLIEGKSTEESSLENHAADLLRQLSSCKNFNTFQEVCSQISKPCIEPEQINSMTCNQKYNLNCPAGYYAYKTSGTKNSCLYQAISLLLVGTEILQDRLRLALIIQSVKDLDLYKDQLRKYEKVDLGMFFQDNLIDSDGIDYEEEDKDSLIETCLQRLIMETAKTNTDSSRFHVLLLSAAINRRIEQYFQKEYANISLKIKLDIKCDESLPPFRIFWVNFSEQTDVMNHIVPLFAEEQKTSIC